MRIILLIDKNHAADAAIVLETVGFVADEDAGDDEKDGLLQVRGEMPEKDLHELATIAGVRDWKVAPLEEEDARSPTWPWKQKPETD